MKKDKEMSKDKKRSLIERLNSGPVICAEGFLFEIERRGYMRSGEFVPMVSLEHPEALENLHRDFQHSGSDIVQAFTYNGHREKMKVIGKEELLEPLNRAALKIAKDEEALKLINEEEIKNRAVEATEQTGIVFIDEIDKVTNRSEHNQSGVSREGVQRDLLPLIEGSTVTTKYGSIKTDHILFIGSGAFHLSKPSDLIPELQGRLPIRVELNRLSIEDFQRILEEPDASLTEQYQALLKTEDLEMSFSKDGIEKIAEIAWQVNEKTENIGARRLHTVMERLLEEVSFSASDLAVGDNKTLVIDRAYVETQLDDLAKDEDLSRYIL